MQPTVLMSMSVASKLKGMGSTGQFYSRILDSWCRSIHSQLGMVILLDLKIVKK